MPSDQISPVFRYAQFDIRALCRISSSLRQDTPCTCDIDQYPASGSFNWAIFITFEDGVEWILRSPHMGHGEMAIEIGSKLLASEAATLKYLNLNSDIPVPVVHSYSTTGHNDIGIPFILMSKAPGWPLERAWKSLGSEKPHMADDLKVKVLYQLGQITYKLSRLRFDCIGSLLEENGIFEVGECLSRGHVLNDRYSLEDVPRGPFHSNAEFFDSLVTSLIQHAEVLPLSHHCFVAPVPSPKDFQSNDQYRRACDLWNDFVAIGKKIDSSDNRLDYTVAANILQELITQWDSKLPKPDVQSFPLSHSDLSVNNIYVDDDYNITRIIDWAFSSTVPEAMMLAPPGLPQSRNELDEDLVVSFKNGFKSSAETALDLLQQSKVSWPLSRLLNFDSIDDYSLFAAVWDNAYGCERDMKAFFAEQRSLPSYTKLYSEVQLDDEPYQRTQKSEQAYFRNNILRSSVARKLTLVSQWKSQYMSSTQNSLRKGGELFVTNSRLWKWILEFQQEWEDMVTPTVN
ncbi:RNase H domain-containing protein [Aspergillus heteromorphus CBS 117.55]|uniref:RNase H domain-containing protein n=1 Tax=Aspergillus heteromorphus CBS 117.55 TaxID=1448321 RepID=A0A317VQ38_9EURO|nr:RNase H domain-containing protein [Aspergillus heteromorphus CBS 117.55]PWY75381.1 RNase H domain-containing protein [Aspergillus heteromorphus CBS 117.55]